MSYPPFQGSSWNVFDTIMSDYGEMLCPGEGFGSCTFSAKNTLRHIENELSDECEDYPQYSKPWNRDRLRLFQEAMCGRLQTIAADSQEAVVLRFMVDYLSGIEAFLIVGDDPENPQKLRHYASYFERLKQPLAEANLPERSGLQERADLAAKWCRDHLPANLRAVPECQQTIPSSDSSGTQSKLADAIEKTDVERVRHLLASGADANAVDHAGWAPIHRARNVEIAELLIRNGADVNARIVGASEEAALNLAASFGSKELVELLVKHGAEIDSRSKSGNTPLIRAVIKNDMEIVRLLLDAGADPDIEGDDGSPRSQADGECLRLIERYSRLPKARSDRFGASPSPAPSALKPSPRRAAISTGGNAHGLDDLIVLVSLFAGGLGFASYYIDFVQRNATALSQNWTALSAVCGMTALAARCGYLRAEGKASSVKRGFWWGGGAFIGLLIGLSILERFPHSALTVIFALNGAWLAYFLSIPLRRAREAGNTLAVQALTLAAIAFLGLLFSVDLVATKMRSSKSNPAPTAQTGNPPVTKSETGSATEFLQPPTGKQAMSTVARSTVVISTQPTGAAVRMDNGEPQNTPVRFGDVSAGSHRVEVTLDGYEPVVQQVNTKVAETVDLGALRLIRSVGLAKIVTKPEGLEFEIRNAEFGTRVGKAPQVLDNLPTGIYEISVKRDKWAEQKKQITVSRGATATAEFEFPMGRFKISSEPARAAIKVAGKEVGLTPLVLEDLPPGEVVCDVKLKGYVPAQVQASIVANQEVPVKIRLEKVGPKADKSWTNSLGLKFVPVPGTAVMFSVWDTRVKDFEVFATATRRVAMHGMECIGPRGWAIRQNDWRSPGFSQTANDPVVGVSWEDAKEFCRWLTEKERNEEIIALDQTYRLPASSEWRRASGGFKYPWGDQWPPPLGAGNYAGQEFDFPKYGIRGYRDNFPHTAPVGSFSPNELGIYDLGGNVWQWCEDRPTAEELPKINSPPKATGLAGLLRDNFMPPSQASETSPASSAKPHYFLCGGSWGPNSPEQLETSFRAARSSDARCDAYGFRLVLDLQGNGGPGGTGTPAQRVFSGQTYQGGTYQGTTYQGTTYRGGTYQSGSGSSGLLPPRPRQSGASGPGISETNRPSKR